jgi:endonuclease-3
MAPPSPSRSAQPRAAQPSPAQARAPQPSAAGPGTGARRRSRPRTPAGRARLTAARLAEEYPGSAKELCALRHDGPFQLLVATILSAQTTDERVNQVTPALFRSYPTPADLAGADPSELEELIRPTGFFRSKARSLIGMARALEERYGGQVPTAMEDLVTLPGVGRKTANVVLSVGMGLPGLPVDTHVGRVSRRLGLTVHTDPVKVEQDLTAMLPPEEWGVFSLRMILHGRRVCIARRPRCEDCILNDFCPSAILPSRRSSRANAGPAATQPPARRKRASALPAT